MSAASTPTESPVVSEPRGLRRARRVLAPIFGLDQGATTGASVTDLRRQAAQRFLTEDLPGLDPPQLQALAAFFGCYFRQGALLPQRQGHDPQLHCLPATEGQDHFVHADLAGFLGAELDRYVGVQLLDLDRLARADQERQACLALASAVRDAGRALIGQLAQAEARLLAALQRPKLVLRCDRVLPLADVESFVSQHEGFAPVGALLDVRTMGLNRQMYYFATHAWGDQVLGIAFGFEDDGRMGGLFIKTMAESLEYPHADHVSELTFEVPFEGLYYVIWGGMEEIDNYHQAHANQAYAYDIVVWNHGGTCMDPCEQVDDYFIYGQPLYASAGGEVVVAEDGHPDMLPGVETDAVNPAGNTVTIQVSDDEYLFVAHMQPGSVAVDVGDTVAAGDLIGAVGNSGNTSEPHIHMHLQDGPDLFGGARSMPMDFSNLVIDGTPTDLAMPLGGQFIRRDD